VSALTQPNVGAYLNRHFVSSFQKVGTFQIVHGQKQGGNVASYFCTADGDVLHAVAGPAGGHVILREARWVNETYNMAQLENYKTPAELRTFFRRAHLQRLQNDYHVRLPADRLPAAPVARAKHLRLLLQQNHHLGLDAQGKVHLMLAVTPLVSLDQVYRVVFEDVLNEKVSTNPVDVAGR
jgi:hypothetical protein